MRFFKMEKCNFLKKDPAKWFKHQRFRKWETKTKIKTLDLGVDLFFEPGYTWKAVCKQQLSCDCVIIYLEILKY